MFEFLKRGMDTHKIYLQENFKFNLHKNKLQMKLL